jgi:hypothetical protein
MKRSGSQLRSLIFEIRNRRRCFRVGSQTTLPECGLRAPSVGPIGLFYVLRALIRSPTSR